MEANPTSAHNYRTDTDWMQSVYRDVIRQGKPVLGDRFTGHRLDPRPGREWVEVEVDEVWHRAKCEDLQQGGLGSVENWLVRIGKEKQ